ncbi:MAG TPA: hypothetical protein PKN50_00970 [Spirochaetota bacterium]|jgi:hypothetical protein|nr:hypothetical protein [Spirochaetota bacterium]HPV40307.1 hypothetical protein [Spirochaetota bacterium]
MSNKGAQINRAYIGDQDDVFLANSLFGEDCCHELKEIDKHEIIVKICEILGPNPSNLQLAEEILDQVKYDITRFVIHHEYCKCNNNSVRSQLLLWLDGKINPDNARKLSSFMDKYLR